MPELPYAPFYFSDWLGDTKVRRMTYEERGVYFELLANSWQEPIPADLNEVAHLLGIPRRKLDSLWKKVGACWVSDGNGSLLNPRLERERAKQKGQQKAGKRRAELQRKRSR